MSPPWHYHEFIERRGASPNPEGEAVKTSEMIIRPTIASLQDLLDRLVETGWNQHQQIQIKQMANAPEIFSLEAVEIWIGKQEVTA